MFLSFMFASEEEMGYDPFVTQCEDGQSYIYQIGIKGEARFFKTVGLLAEYRSLCITGRHTRIWEVKEYDLINQTVTGDCTMALKDLWLDKGAQTERNIQKDIFKSIHDFAMFSWDQHPCLQDFCPEMKDRFKDALDGEKYKKYFLHIECNYQGKTSKSVAPSAHQQLDLFSLPIPSSCPSSPGFGDPNRIVDMQFPVPATYENHRYVPKRQYRLVYKEVCVALHDLHSLHDVLNVLGDCLVGRLGFFISLPVLKPALALQLLYCAGWVHRDISSGNVLAFTASGTNPLQGKLSDLEYAKIFPSTTASPDPKTVSISLSSIVSYPLCA
jgi:hypothetical protein